MMQKDFYCATDFIVNEEEIWYVALGYNHLCCYDYKNCVMKKRVILPVENSEVRLFENLVKVDNYLVLIPSFAKNVIVFDMLKENCISLSLEEHAGKNIRFYDYYIKNKIVYFFPRGCGRNDINPYLIGKLNLENMDLSFSDSLKELIKLPGHNVNVEIFHRDCIKLKEEIIFLYGNTNMVCIYNCNHETYEMRQVDNTTNMYFTICQIDEMRFCLSNQFGDIILWNRMTDGVQKIKYNIAGMEREKSERGTAEEMFRHSIYYNGMVYFFPMFCNKALQYDVARNEVREAYFSKLIIGGEKPQYPCFYSKLSNVHIMNDKMYIWNIRRRILYEIDLKSEQINEFCIEVQMEKSEIKQCMDEWSKEKGEIFQESKLLYMNLQSLLELH